MVSIMRKKPTIAVIVGAGRGQRFGGDIPKQYCSINGEPVLRHTLRVFCEHTEIDHVQPIIHPDDINLFREAADNLNVLNPTWGGKNRQCSVFLGLKSIAKLSPARVLIHDAARPFVTPSLISRTLREIDHFPGAIPALLVNDTLKIVSEIEGVREIKETLPRDHVWQAQTPQAFDFKSILAAHEAAVDCSLTDDAAVAEQFGLKVAIVEGSLKNIKITTTEDLQRAQATNYEYKTGLGFDVHAFTPGDQITLCGITIPHDRALAGHSDADVGLHAATDAVLGAISEGDIGDHFPPTDPQWLNASSDQFLRYAIHKLHQRGGSLVNLDITVICETPKIGPYRARMRQRIAEIIGTNILNINVKATTTERLGFTGRQEGIAAQAITSIRLLTSISH